MADDNPTTTTAPNATTPPPVEFRPITSQEEFDGLVGRRVAREREVGARAEREKFSDYEELKAAASKLAELEAADQTELEKAQTRAEEAEKRSQQIEAEVKETRLRSAIIAEAAKADRKIVDAEAVVALLDRSSLELDDSGVPTNIAKAMDSLLEAKPFLVAADGGARGNADQGARPQGGIKQLTRDDLKTMTPEQVAMAEAEGQLASLLGSPT